MPEPNKTMWLQRQRTFHPHHDEVREPLFVTASFFDPCDLLQVKYEMLRRVRCDRWSVSQACTLFGVARSSYYEAVTAWQEAGLVGLLPEHPGPRQPRKLTPEVWAWLQAVRPADGLFDAAQLAQLLWQQHGLRLHPRTLEKALRTPKKKSAVGDDLHFRGFRHSSRLKTATFPWFFELWAAYWLPIERPEMANSCEKPQKTAL